MTSPGDSGALLQYGYIWPAESRNLHSQTWILEMLIRRTFVDGWRTYWTVGTSTNVGPYKRRTYKRRTVQTSDLQTSDRTNVGQDKGRTVQTSDWYKRQTGTDIGLVQTSDRTNIRLYSKKINSNLENPQVFSWNSAIKKNLKLSRRRSTIHRPVMLQVGSMLHLSFDPTVLMTEQTSTTWAGGRERWI